MEPKNSNTSSKALPTGLFPVRGWRMEFIGKPPAGDAIFVAASRLGRNLESKTGFFDALRTLVCGLDPTHHYFVTAAGVTADRFVRRAASLYGISVCNFKIDDGNVPGTFPTSEQESVCLISQSSGLNRKPDLDDFLIRAAKRVYATNVRRNGRTCRALAGRLAHRRDTRILIDKSLTAQNLQAEFLAAGATAWWLYRADCDRLGTDHLGTDHLGTDRLGTGHPGLDQLDLDDDRNLQTVSSSSPLLSLDEIAPLRLLAHWTRRCAGRWPDQTQNAYLDDLLFGAHRANHSALSSLCRILASDRLLGSNDLTRSRQPVVSFTSVPLSEFAEHRRFRNHLARWDFEPFGIAFDRNWLQSLGAREVIYGRDDQFESLPDSDRPFFQLATGRNKEDWTAEKEWRLIGNLDLKLPGPTDAVVFVPDLESARTVSTLSRWPVVVLSTNGKQSA
ncbi:MAG: hypothetical protein AAF456_22815 [Planctomycetota bacterium]